MRKIKALGLDGMHLETFYLINEQNLETIVRLFNNIYGTGHFPEHWLCSTFITLPKSNCAVFLCSYRFISLVGDFLKLFRFYLRLYKNFEGVSETK